MSVEHYRVRVRFQGEVNLRMLQSAFVDGGASFPAVDSSQLDVGQGHADQQDSQQSHWVLPEAPHRVVDALYFQELLPWDSAARWHTLRMSEGCCW